MISFPSVNKQNSLQLIDTLDHVNLYSIELLSPVEQNKILSKNDSNLCVKSYDNTVLLRNPSDLQSLLVQNSKSSCLSQTSTSNSNASENVILNHEQNAVKKCNYNIFSRYIHSPVHRTLSNMYSENNQKAGMYPFGVCTVKLPPALNEPTERVFIPHAPYIKTVPVFAPFIHNVQHTSHQEEELLLEEEMNIMEELPIEHVTKMRSNTATKSSSLSTSTLVTSASTISTEEQAVNLDFNASASYDKNEEKEVNHLHSNQVSSAFSSLETLEKLENTLPRTFEPNTEQESREWNFPPSISESIQFTLSAASNQSPASPPLSLSSESLSLAARVSPLPTVTSSEPVINTESLAGPVTSTVVCNEEVTRVPKEMNLSPEPEPPKLLMSLSSHTSTSVTHHDTVAEEINSPIMFVKKAVDVNSTREVEEHISPQISETILISSGSWTPKNVNDNNDSDDVALLTSFRKRWLENGRGRGLLERQQRYWNRLLRSKVTLQAPESVPECTSDDLSSSSHPAIIAAAAPLSNTNSSATSHLDSTTININCSSDILAPSAIDKKNESRELSQDVLHGSVNAMNSSCQNQSNKMGKRLVSLESSETSLIHNIMRDHLTDQGKLNDVNTQCESYSEVVKESDNIASNVDTDNSIAKSNTTKEKQKTNERENALSEATYELTKYKPRFNMYKSDGTVRRVNRYSVYSNSSYVPSTRSFDDESPDSNLRGSISAGFAVPQSTKENLAKVCKVVSPTRKSDGSHVDYPYEPVSHVSSTALPSAYDHNDVNSTNRANIINKGNRRGDTTDDDDNDDDYVHSFNPVQHHESKN